MKMKKTHQLASKAQSPFLCSITGWRQWWTETERCDIFCHCAASSQTSKWLKRTTVIIFVSLINLQNN